MLLNLVIQVLPAVCDGLSPHRGDSSCFNAGSSVDLDEEGVVVVVQLKVPISVKFRLILRGGLRCVHARKFEEPLHGGLQYERAHYFREFHHDDRHPACGGRCSQFADLLFQLDKS